MKLLITGASGALGSSVVAALTTGGHEVVGVSRRPREGQGEGGGEGSSMGRGETALRWIVADLAHDDAVAAIAAEFGPDVVVIHLAAAAGPDLEPTQGALRRAIDVDVLGTMRLLEAVGRAGAARVVFASTSAERTSGVGLFGAVKLAGEDHLRVFEEESGVPASIVRLGPRDVEAAAREVVLAATDGASGTLHVADDAASGEAAP